MPPYNTWTSEQRHVTHLLHSRYNLSKASKAAIFNEIFIDYLREQNLPNGVGYPVLEVQYRRRREAARVHLWAAIIRDPANAAEQATRDAHVRSIEAAATALNVPLQRAQPAPTASQGVASADAGLDSENMTADSDDTRRTQQALTHQDESLPDRSHAQRQNLAANTRENVFSAPTSLSISAINPQNNNTTTSRPLVEKEDDEVLPMLHSSALA